MKTNDELMNYNIINTRNIFNDIDYKKFNEVKKQIIKYQKQRKTNDFILHYIAFNKSLFDICPQLDEIVISDNEEIIENSRYEILCYIRKVIALCWYLNNNKDSTHKYQIQMINENKENFHNGEARKIYQKTLNLNRSVGANYKKYIPFTDISNYGGDNNNTINDAIDEMLYFIPYYIQYKSMRNKKSYLGIMLCHHPLFSFIQYSYDFFGDHTKKDNTKSDDLTF